MSSKRVAETELNHENWDQEEEPQEAGEFKRASEAILKHRVIRTAKRRNPIHSSPEGEGSKLNVFGSFSFSKSPATPTNSFNFLSNPPKNEVPQTNGTLDKSMTEKNHNSKESESKTSVPIFTFASSTKNTTVTQKEDNLDNYYAKIKGLNESVAKWINKHVDANPLINLQPIFKDYDKFLDEIEKEKGNAAWTPKVSDPTKKDESSSQFANFTFKSSVVPNNLTQKSPTNASTLQNTPALFKFTPPDPKASSLVNKITPITTTAESKTNSSGFSFFNSASSSTSTVPTFSFGNTTTASSLFPKASTSFAFTAVSKPPEQSSETNEEDNDEPPKVEVKEVEEEGSFYTIRCKVFVKTSDGYKDHGLGNLFLKPVPDSEKTQLIVRAHNNLGNVLCNFILSEGVPMQRVGKNNVNMICIPTPESKPPPVSVLLRVKSEEDADQLLATLKKYKK